MVNNKNILILVRKSIIYQIIMFEEGFILKKIMYLLPVILLGLSGCSVVSYDPTNSGENSVTSQGDNSQEGTSVESTVASQGGSAQADWPESFKTTMNSILGRTIPFIQLDSNTWQCVEGYDEGSIQVYDDSETDLLQGYGDILVRNGYVYSTEFKDYELSLGGTSLLIIEFGWSEGFEGGLYSGESYDPEPPGNIIDAYLWDTTWDE